MGLPDQVKVPYLEGYDFGIGVNLASGGPKNQAVAGQATPVGPAPGATVRFHVKRVNTTGEMEESLAISAEANYGCAAFGAGVSGRFAFAQSAKVQSSSLTMLITASVKLGFEQIDAPALTPTAASHADNPSLFGERYGNMFVRGISRGGLFAGYLRIDTGSSELSQSISAELSGSYGLFSAEAKSKFAAVQRKYRSELTIDMYHEGGPVDLHIAEVENPMELLRNVNEFLKSFAERPNEVAVPYSVTLAPLSIADGPNPPNQVDIEHAQDVIIFCAQRRSKLIDQLNTFQYIVDNPSRFDFSNGADIGQIRAAVENVQSDMALIRSCASRAMNSPASACFPEVFAEETQQQYPKTVVPDPLPTPKPVRTQHSTDKVEIFTHADYAADWQGIPGRSQKLEIGSYDDAKSQIMIGNDQISAVKVPEGLVMRGYEHAWFQGAFIDFTSDTPAVPMEWNDRISSLIVYHAEDGPPRIDYVVALDYQWSRPVLQLKVGKYPDLSTTTLGVSALSVLLIPAGLAVRLWEFPEYQGATIDLYGDTLVMPPGWDNRASSLEVFEYAL
ncbi:hypothetical protein SAMN04244553_6516 [Nocardia amikacinitolerans]|uniref:Uncharacterized protein n=1 Tax=Nocardia amikacinitolerans TaxID=756689 RepID=A0A285LX69_9NOCA|nr:hypothetical protein [Nocardia amikacinitolerans]MCP2279592.1 hypothetical protein [Nocardia amikacinitolerans]SNY89498.1 hypothetical protein SAMN04244553_6516 [Nocardia amikacinitolerans]